MSTPDNPTDRQERQAINPYWVGASASLELVEEMTKAVQEGEGLGLDQGMSATFDQSQCGCGFFGETFVTEADEAV